MPVKLLRLDSEIFKPSPLERKLVKEAGIDAFIEIKDDDPDKILAIQPDVIAIVSGHLHRSTIMNLHNCRAIMRMGNGYDKIDVDAATEKGIIVTNVPNFCEHEMAEHSMALLLAAARRLTQMENSLYQGTFIDYKRDTYLQRIYGSTLGIIGFGRSAKNVAKIANAFGMRVLDFHRHVKPEIEAQYNVIPVDFDTLLKESDYVMLLCPLTTETRGMIGERELKLMKKTAVLINAARGAICDEAALAHALKEKWIAYAAIDVYEHIDVFKHPDKPLNCYYFGLENVLLTPHIGGTSIEGEIEIKKIMYEQLKSIISNKFPPHCVNPEVRNKLRLGIKE